MDGPAMDCQPSNNQWVRIFWAIHGWSSHHFFLITAIFVQMVAGSAIAWRFFVICQIMAGSSHMWPNSGWPHKAGSSHMWPKRGHIWLDPAICGQKAKYGWIEPYVDENQQHMAGCSHMWVKNPHIIMAGSSLKKLFGWKINDVGWIQPSSGKNSWWWLDPAIIAALWPDECRFQPSSDERF